MARQTKRQTKQKRKTINAWAQGVLYTTLLMHSSFVPMAFAGPQGGQVTGGAGSISQSGNTTTINQSSQNMSINWNSYNVNVDERVQYIQPNSQSISLNKILSNQGSTIAGRIDANGQVILVNPNGVFFTPTAVINAGGLIASGLDIKADDFMNGNYIFNEVLGTDGTVVNSGTINASLGGNVALIGKQVKNDGVIVANLGTVNLAAGKEAVLTFDQGGLLGVRVSKEILQDELGIDPAVVNNGEITAEGGRVLLTASVSRDVFSQAVNTTGIDQATSVVVHEDGSFTLGGGADVVNTGSINTSTSSSDQNIGRIVLIGENVTSSGELRADAQNGNAGDIELHAQDKALLTENSITSARSESNGVGGITKILGDKVGVFDQSTIDVSGSNGGGQALIGGDFQGNNANIRNSSVTIVNGGTNIYADALENGDGGKVILWADGNTFFWGNIFARSGAVSGNGGLVETSGKTNLLFAGYVDMSASNANGTNGLLLLDPDNITIGTTNDDNGQLSAGDLNIFFGDSPSSDFDITATHLASMLGNGDVVLQARNDILVESAIDSSGNSGSLTLRAGDDIFLDADINLGSGNFTALTSSNCSPETCGGGEGDGRSIFLYRNLTTTGNVNITAHDTLLIDATGGGSDNGRINTNTSTGNGNVTLTSVNGIIQIEGDINTNGGNFIANALDSTNGFFNSNFANNDGSIGGDGISGINTGTGSVTITTAGDNGAPNEGVVLGKINAGSLNVTATGGELLQSQNAPRNLVITGTTTLNAGTNILEFLNTANNLQGAITVINADDATINNNAANTILAAVTVGNDFTVNAEQNLTLTGNIDVGNNANLNFGRDNQDGRVFTLNPSLTIDANGNNVNVTGRDGNDVFNINGGVVAGTTFNLDGGNGDDTFNIGTDTLVATIDGNGGTGDRIVGADSANTNAWVVDTQGAGSTLTNNGNVVDFSNIENLDGGSGVDTFRVESGSTLNEIRAGGQNDGFDIRGTITLLEGNGGDDQITIDVGGDVTTLDSGAGNDTVLINGLVGAVNDSDGTNGITVNGGGRVTGAITTTAGGTDTITIGDSGNGRVGSIVAGDGSNNIIIGANGTVDTTITGGAGVDNIDVDGNVGTDISTLGADDVINLSGTVGGVVNAGSTGETIGDTVNIDAATNRIVQLAATPVGAEDYTVTNAETIDASASGGVNTLRGFTSGSNNTWTVNATNSGSVVNDGTTTVNFVEFASLEGSGIVDDFTVSAAIGNIITGNGVTNSVVFNAGANLSGNVTGGSQTDTITINAGAVTFGLTSLIHTGLGTDFFIINSDTVTNVTLNGGGDTDRLTSNVVTGTNTWNIGGTNTLSNTGGSSVSFVNVDDFYGSNGVDNFNFVTGVIGDIFSNGGTDVITINGALSVLNAGDGDNNILINTSGNVTSGLISGTGNDTINIVGTAASISAGDGDNGITVSGTVTNAITGGAGVDTVTVSGTVDADGSAGTSISTLGGDDVINLSGTVGGVINAGTQTTTDTVNITAAGDRIVQISTVTVGAGEHYNITGAEIIDADGTTGNTLGNTLRGSNAGHNWTVSDINDGTFGTNVFRNFAHLAGGSGVDNFTVNANVSSVSTGDGASNGVIVSATGSVTGDIIGGAGNDAITIQNGGSARSISTAGGNDTITLYTPGVLTLAQPAVAIDGGVGGTDTLIISRVDAANNWALQGDGTSGTVTNLLEGVARNFAGIDGFGDGAGGGILDYSMSNSNITVDLNVITGFSAIVGNYNGDPTVQATLIGRNGVTNDWTIGLVTPGAGNQDGLNDGTVFDGTNTITFVDFDNLTGGNGTDNFTIANVAGGTVSGPGGFDGVIDGGTGTNTLTGRANLNNNWTINNGSNHVVSYTDAAVSALNPINTQFTRINDLTGGGVIDTFTVNAGASIGSINMGDGINTLNILATGSVTGTITGGTGVDDITVAGSAGSSINLGDGNNTLNILATGSVTGTITGGTGIDDITVAGSAGSSINMGDGGNTLNTLATGTVTGTITSGTGVDTITVAGSATAINTGAGDDFVTISGSAASIDTGVGTDTITLNGGATVSGLIDAGADLNDMVTIDTSATRIVQLGSTPVGGEDYLINGAETINAVNLAAGSTLQSEATGAIHNWDVNIAGSTVDSINFTGFTNLVGNSDADTFVINSGASIASITTGDGNNTVTVNGSVTGAITGGANTDTINISGSANTIDAMGGDDTITISGNGTVSGLIDAGTGLADVVTIDTTATRIVQLGSTPVGGENYLIDNAETINAINLAAGSTLLSEATGANHNWNVTANNSGVVDGISFNGFSSLIGNADADTFIVNPGASVASITTGDGGNSVTVNGSVSGAITGGANADTINISGTANSMNSMGGNDTITILGAGTVSGLIDAGAGASDVVNIDTVGPRIVQLGATPVGGENYLIDNAETVNAIGSAVNSTLLSEATGATHNWTINGSNSGTVDVVTFSNFSDLIGNLDADNFTVNAGASIGSINTGEGLNTVLVGGTVTGTIFGGANVDTVTVQNTGVANAILSGGDADVITVVTGGTAGNINAGNGANNITIAGSSGDVVGGLNDDTINVSGTANSISSAEGNDNITVSGTISTLLIDAGTSALDNDTVNISGVAPRIVQLGTAPVGGEDYVVAGAENLNATNGAVGSTLRTAATGANHTWDITGNNSGTVDGVNFNQFADLVGNADVDVFNVTAGNSIANITTGDGLNNVNVAGTVTGTITGGLDSDTIDITLNGAVNGLIDGGFGNDTMNVNTNTPQIVQLGTTPIGGEDLLVTNVENINAINNAVGSTLRGLDAAPNTWTISADNAGTVGAVTFAGFSNLVGGSLVDDFTINAQISTIMGGDGADLFTINNNLINATISGNNGDDTFTVNGNVDNVVLNGNADNDRFTVGTVTDLIVNGDSGTDSLGSNISGFSFTLGNNINIAGVQANQIEAVSAVNGIINAQDLAGVTTTWTINDNDQATLQGTVTDTTGQNLSFSGFVTFNGQSGQDIFIVNDNGSVSGLISGGGNNDSLTVNLSNNRTNAGGIINFDGGTGTNTVTLTSAGGPYTETYNPSITNVLGSFDQHVYSNDTQVGDLTVSYRSVSTVNDNVSASTLTINSANALSDVIELGNNTYGSALSQQSLPLPNTFMVSYQNLSKGDIVVNSQGTSDVVIANDVNLNPATGDLTITADSVTGSGLISANSLTLNAVNTAGVSSNNRLNTNVTDLSVINPTGTIFIEEFNTVNLANINSAGGVVDIRTIAGNITGSTALNVGGSLILDANTDINLGGANNFSGPLTMTAGNNVVLTGNNTITASTNLTAANMLSITGVNTVSAPLQLNAPTINVTNAANQIIGPVVLNGANVTLTNGTDTNLGGGTVTNILTVSTTGNINDSGAFAMGTNTVANFTATGNVSLVAANTDFDVLRLTAGSATIRERNALNLEQTTVTNTLDVIINQDGGIGALNVGGITATAQGSSINLDAQGGAIVNSGSNIQTPGTLRMRASRGIGDVGNGPISTNVATLNVVNNSPGGITPAVGINNSRSVSIVALQNGGDITLDNDGDITLLNNESISGNVGGVSFNDDPMRGDATVTINGNGLTDITTTGTGDFPDIVAHNLLITGVRNVGEETPRLPIRIRVNEDMTILASGQLVLTYIGNRPRSITTTGDLLVIDGFVGLSGQQLIDLETLGELDPAIFTEVRNYIYDDIAILLPKDQRYTDDEEDKKRAQELEQEPQNQGQAPEQEQQGQSPEQAVEKQEQGQNQTQQHAPEQPKPEQSGPEQKQDKGQTQEQAQAEENERTKEM